MIKVGSQLPDFSLESSTGGPLAANTLKNKTAVLMFASQKSIKTVDRWFDEVNSRVGKRDDVAVAIVGVLNQLPGFVPKTAVVARLKRMTSTPILMDMKGVVAEALGVVNDTPVIVVAKNGVCEGLFGSPDADFYRVLESNN